MDRPNRIRAIWVMKDGTNRLTLFYEGDTRPRKYRHMTKATSGRLYKYTRNPVCQVIFTYGFLTRDDGAIGFYRRKEE